ncbi:MAG: DUF1992 domain-containing protein [Ardenticatenaceae bacterium]|nr:DUF1992 domain-containing protein [Ardenticatenaceae bacterium]
MDRDSQCWERLVDRLINEARERGEFDPKGTAGRRLTDDHGDAFEGDMWLANKVLNNGGYAPEFILLNQEIEADVQRLRATLRAGARRRKRLRAEAERLQGSLAERYRQEAEAGWQQALAETERRVPEVNDKILTFNLKNRVPNMHRYRVQLEALAAEVAAEVEAEEGSPSGIA